MKVLSFGDSITLGSAGLTDPNNAYVKRFQTYLSATLDQKAAGGSCALEVAKAVDGYAYPTPLPAFDVCVMMVGVNDSQRYFTSPQQEYYRGFLLEAIIRASCVNRVHAQDMTLSNVVSLGTAVPWAKLTSTNNPAVYPAQWTATVSGTAVYIGALYSDWLQHTGANLPATSLEIRIDGVLMPNPIVSNAPGAFTSGTEGYYGPFVQRYAGLSAGSHTVNVKVTNAGFLYLSHITGSDQPTNPPIYVGTPTRQFQPNVDPTGAAISALQQIVMDSVTQLQADGRNVFLFDCGADIVQSDLAADLIHPTDAGHLKIFNRLKAAWDANQAPPAYVDGLVRRRTSDNAIVYRDADGTHETVIG